MTKVTASSFLNLFWNPQNQYNIVKLKNKIKFKKIKQKKKKKKQGGPN